MQLNDAVPERRNLIVFCMATVIFFIGGGNACGELKMPFLGITLTNHLNMAIFYWIVFIYLFWRYWVVFRAEPYIKDSNKYESNPKYISALTCALREIDSLRNIYGKLQWGIEDNAPNKPLDTILDQLKVDDFDKKNIKIRFVPKSFDDTSSIVELRLECEVKGSTTVIRSSKLHAFDRYTWCKSFLYLALIPFHNKYLFDWVFPFQLLIATLAIVFYQLILGGYSICPVV